MFICQHCGTIAIEDGVCCEQQRVPLEEAVGMQERLFELSGNERAQHVMKRLKKIVEHAAERVNKAEDKLAKAIAEREAALGVLVDFYRLTTSGDDGTAADAATD